MPRGPSGRACEACHAQKKKCDLRQPSCSRCERLRIPCVGAGVQRFRFVDGKKSVPFRSQQAPGALTAKRASFQILPRTPLNETELLAQSFTTRLNQSEDVGRSLAWAWGPQLLEIPRRLGRNKALDEAARTILIDHADVLIGENRIDPVAPGVVHLLKATGILRGILDDPIQRSEAETLAAVFLISISQCRFQGLITPYSSFHGSGALELLRLRRWPKGKDNFERHLYDDIKAISLYQSFVNPSIRLTPDEYQNLADNFQGTAPDYKLLQCGIKISEVLCRARELIAEGASIDLEALQALMLQQELLNIAETLRKRLYSFKPLSHNLPLSTKLHAHYQRSYSRALTFHAMLLAARRTLSPEDTTVDEDAEILCSHAMQLSKEGHIYLPLAWRFAWSMLMPVWGSTLNLETRREIEEELVACIWHSETPTPTARRLTSDQLEYMAVRLSLHDPPEKPYWELVLRRGQLHNYS